MNQPIMNRIDALARLPTNWDGNDGLAMKDSVLQEAKAFVEAHHKLPTVYISLTGQGNLHFCFNRRGSSMRSLELEFQGDGAPCFAKFRITELIESVCESDDDKTFEDLLEWVSPKRHKRVNR